MATNGEGVAGVGWKIFMLKERGGIHEGRTKKREHLKKLRSIERNIF